MVIAIIGILAGLLLPALSQGKQRALTVACQNNLKQLAICWHSYAGDNEDVMVPNNFVYLVSVGSSTNSSLGEDSLTWCRGITPLDTNEITATTSLLFNYNQTAAIYHCPADRSTVEGFPGKLRNRSYNMSNSIQCWQDNHFRKFGDILVPSNLFVFIDTHEDAIWDSTFGTLQLNSRYQDYWLDVPANRHQRGANLTFADGHVERWQWKFPKSGYLFAEHYVNNDDRDDLRRMQQHIKGQGGN